MTTPIIPGWIWQCKDDCGSLVDCAGMHWADDYPYGYKIGTETWWTENAPGAVEYAGNGRAIMKATMPDATEEVNMTDWNGEGLPFNAPGGNLEDMLLTWMGKHLPDEMDKMFTVIAPIGGDPQSILNWYSATYSHDHRMAATRIHELRPDKTSSSPAISLWESGAYMTERRDKGYSISGRVSVDDIYNLDRDMTLHDKSEVVWRGAATGEYDYTVGEMLDTQHFTSASTTLHTPAGFGAWKSYNDDNAIVDTIFEIWLHPGIMTAVFNRGEREVLIERLAQYRVTSVSRDEGLELHDDVNGTNTPVHQYVKLEALSPIEFGIAAPCSDPLGRDMDYEDGRRSVAGDYLTVKSTAQDEWRVECGFCGKTQDYALYGDAHRAYMQHIDRYYKDPVAYDAEARERSKLLHAKPHKDPPKKAPWRPDLNTEVCEVWGEKTKKVLQELYNLHKSGTSWPAGKNIPSEGRNPAIESICAVYGVTDLDIALNTLAQNAPKLDVQYDKIVEKWTEIHTNYIMGTMRTLINRVNELSEWLGLGELVTEESMRRKRAAQIDDAITTWYSATWQALECLAKIEGGIYQFNDAFDDLIDELQLLLGKNHPMVQHALDGQRGVTEAHNTPPGNGATREAQITTVLNDVLVDLAKSAKST